MLRLAMLSAVLLVVGGLIIVYDVVNRPLPEHSGIAEVEGLHASVEVLRDDLGVPHIYASNLHDLFFAQGYVQAQDRWWQMEFWRYTASGRLCELVGRNDSALRADIFLRTLGWRYVAEAELAAMDDETRSHLEAFSAGVNAYISDRSPSELALEYTVLGLTGIEFEVEPWSPLDTLVFAKLMAWDMGLEESKDILRGALYETIGPEMTDAWLTPAWPYDERPTIVHQDDLPEASSATEGEAFLTPSATGASAFYPGEREAISAAIGTGPGGGTNAWVVSGSHAASGQPLLANDTHLGIQMPTVWYQIGLHCAQSEDPALDVVGFTFPASPGVVVGHNGHIAWGISNAFPDVHDVYRLRIDPDDPLLYEWDDEWRTMSVREETIRFGDGSPILTFRVRETHLGPITTDNRWESETGAVSGFENDEPLAQRWTALDPGTVSRAVLAIDRAHDWESFRDALRHWDVPAQHFVYADIDGNIGYQLAGRIPIRAGGFDGLVPTVGWTDEHEWKGFLPFELLPHVLNPASGTIVAANHAAVPLGYYAWLELELESEFGESSTYLLNVETDYAYRAQRIHDLLEELEPHTVESFRSMQADTKLLSADEVLPYVETILFADPGLSDAKAWLLNWDRRFDSSSARAVLYAHVWRALVRGIFADELGGPEQLVGGDREMWAVRCLLDEPEHPWWNDVTTDVSETRDDILRRALAEGYTAAIEQHGADRSAWAWGDVHTGLFVSKPLGQSGISLFEGLVNRGPTPMGGMTDTIDNTRWNVSADTFEVKSIPALRMVIDLADLSEGIAIHSTGQSGHPFSANYDSMIEDWQAVEARPLPWTREDVEASADNRLVLIPAGP